MKPNFVKKVTNWGNFPIVEKEIRSEDQYSKIKDFVIRNTANPNNSNAEVEVEFTVIKDNKTILNKIYRKESLGNTIFEIRLTTEEITFRKLQKTVLSINENEFKADLLKALKENK